MMGYAEVNAGCVVIERGGQFYIPYSFGIRDTEPIIQNDNLWKLFETRKPQRISIDIGMQIDALLVAFQPNHVYISPLLYKDVPLGLIIMGSNDLLHERLLQTMELLNQSFAISLNNAITYDQLQKLAANDPLTGLYNRRFGMTRLSEEFIRSIRSQIPLGLLMFDIDHFKQVNDTFGHTAGDRVLVNIAKIAAMAARKGDLIIRYGGEEFIMILPGADKKDCNFIAERLRHMVEESLVIAGDAQIRVTISIGLVSYPEYSVDEEQSLIRVADDALYLAKEKGRNVVVSA
jgi:diguanylate cyclase (GGDEF)-like protein